MFGIFTSLYYLGRKRLYGLVGLAIILFSFLYWYLPSAYLSIGAANLLFYYGNILFFDYLSYEFSGWSPLHTRKWRVGLVTQLLLVGLLGGLTLELYAHWLGKFWYYPHWSFTTYFLIFIPGFAFYFFYLFETYLGVKAVIAYFLKHRHHAILTKHKVLYSALGLVGISGLSAVTVFTFLNATWGSSLYEFLSIINKPIQSSAPFWPYMLVPLFLWFFLEYLEYEHRETSMLSEALEGNLVPLIAIFLSAWISAVVYEVFNLPGGLWRYANVPFADIKLFGIPIVVYLLWPMHYFPIFSLYRVLFKKDTEKMWNG